METGRDTKLWLDDLKQAPPGWVHVRTTAEARALFARGGVVEAYLDHDLGLGPAT